jgi:LDH2 family malate/lactate/ureidoglycolate dehydrogenase
VTAAGGRFSGELLSEFGEAALARCGAAPSAAAIVVGCLLESDRRGVHSHGLIRLRSYLVQARAGEIAASAEPCIVHEHGPTSLLDGRFAFGAVTGVFAMDDAIERALEFGVGVTAVRNGTHFGSAACYSLRAARRSLIGVAATNTPAAMTPWGGADARLGNNPVSVAGPTPGGAPFVLDIAQSVVSRGQIKLTQLAGLPIPDTWALDADGKPTTDPLAALEGALLPMAGHKGSGLALAVELLTGALAGAGLSPRMVNTGLTGRRDSTAATPERGVGHLFVAIDPDRFAGRELFGSRMGDLVAAVKATTPAEGVSEVLVPGEPEHRAEVAAAAKGVALPAESIEELRVLAADEGLVFPEPSRPAGVRNTVAGTNSAAGASKEEQR